MANIVLNYQYHLTNVNWTNDYDNVLRFADKTARNNYFNVNTIFADGDYHLINFNITNLYKTTIVIDCSDYITAMQSNYLIVKNKSKNEYYFYFITDCKQTNYNRVELKIELDIFQQYYYDVEFVDAPINRCKYPLNYLDSGANKYFLKQYTNIVYNVEDYNFQHQYTGKIPAIVGTFKESYFANRLYGWMYVFVDPSHAFECKDWDGATSTVEIAGYTTKPDKLSGIYNNIGVLAFPIYKDNQKIKMTVDDSGDSYSFDLTDAAVILEQLKSGNGGADAAHIYSVKISRRIPFSKYFIDHNTGTIQPNAINMSCSGNEIANALYLLDADVNTYETAVVRIGTYYGLRVVNDANQEYEYAFSASTTDLYPTEAQNEYDPKPKLHMAQYEKCYIDFGDGNKCEFDLAKVAGDNDYFTMYYKEAIVPDITRYSVAFKSAWYVSNNDGSKYANETFTADMTLIFTLDQWSDYLANNKNFYAQGNFNTMMKINKEVISGVGSMGKMDYFGGAKSLINMYTDTLQFTKNREFQVDNIKSSVDRVINQNGNACFNLNMHGIQPVFTYYEIPNADSLNILQKLKMYGVNTVGLIDDIKNYDKSSIGWHYCYIQADVNELKSGQISLECEKALLNIFNKGVRMWFDATYMYNYNY